MALFEKGSKRNRTECSLTRVGNAVRAHEQEAHSARLAGYRACGTTERADAELQKLAAAKLAQGFTPADDAARALVAALPPGASTASKPKTPSLPLRQDVYVYNEATGFAVTTTKMGGKGIEEGTPGWEKAIAAGQLIPIGLYQDDAFIVRVVAGDALTEQEASEWVGRVDLFLDLSKGDLAICGGAEYVMSDDEGGSGGDFVRTLRLPAGLYRATVYAQLHGVNGSACVAAAGGSAGRERLGRSGGDEGQEHVDFLLHLTPDDALADKKSRPKAPALESGWFPETAGARAPAKQPSGLVARDVVGRESALSEDWTYVEDVSAKAASATLAALDEPVSVPLEQAGNVFMLAWFAHPDARPELRVALPEGSAYQPPRRQITQVVEIQDGGTVFFGFGNDLYAQDLLSAVSAAFARVRELPDGSSVELITCQGGGVPQTGLALQRYRGVVSGGAWRIAETSPRTTAAAIEGALAIAAESNAGESIRVADPAEADAILAWLKGNYGPYAFEDNKPSFAGDSIRLQTNEPGLLRLLGASTFAVRYRDRWPVRNLSG